MWIHFSIICCAALAVVSAEHPPTRMLKSMGWALRSRALAFFGGSGARRAASADTLRPLLYDLTRRSSKVEDEITVKLFKLMYETVKECDNKVRRAEAIRPVYSNVSKAFEIGYMFGDVTDKFSTMKDIAATLKRLYNQWTPIEHVNAYEQIANQGIELNHLIDIIKSVYMTPDANNP